MAFEAVEMDNNGLQEQPIRVPGVGLPFDIEIEERFAHGASDWIQSPRLTARELAMLAVMDALTDKTNWHEKIFNEDVVEKWKEEAMGMKLISERAWEWCVLELRDQAKVFAGENGRKGTNFVGTLRTGSGCAKADFLVPSALRNELVKLVAPMIEADEKDWHPGSGEKVLNLVHPSLFPLVYGRSKVLSTGVVGLDDCLESYGRGDVLPGDRSVGTMHVEGGMTERTDRNNVGRWSTKFQWLPCEVEFIKPEKPGDSGLAEEDEDIDVQITSYINNLHPLQQKPLYKVIAKLISLSIPLWNDVLIESEDEIGKGRYPPRIITYGADFEPKRPDWWGNIGVFHDRNTDEYQAALARVKEYISLPENPEYQVEDPEYEDVYLDGRWETNGYLSGAVEWKWKRIRRIVHPEAGTASVFNDWKEGKPMEAVVVPPQWAYGVGDGDSQPHTYYDVALEKTFRDQGLQVIVKLSSIELSPEKPKYDGGNWHVEGMLNEHIVATAIYYYDCDNITTSRIRFRQEAQLDQENYDYDQGDHQPLCEIYGTSGTDLYDERAVQELGSIVTPQGRLLAFPNTLQHRVDPFELVDKSKPGHRRFLVLWLVDPNYRILSTRNVPPQRHDWWAEVAAKEADLESKLPLEVVGMIGDAIGEWPMGMEEAKKLRLELMQERSRMMETVESNFDVYNFCEH
jgi:hypothetical protein